jgi:hypothetical protein
MADFQRVSMDDDALDDELQDGLALTDEPASAERTPG